MKGELHLLPRTARNTDFGLRHLVVPTFLLMNDSANELLCYLGFVTPRDSNVYYYVTASLMPYHIHSHNVTRSFPLVRKVRVPRPTQHMI